MKEAILAAVLKLALKIIEEKLDDDDTKDIKKPPQNNKPKDSELKLEDLLQDVDLDDNDIIKMWKEEGRK